MKIEINDNKTIVYLYQYVLDYYDKEKLSKEIKSLFLKLIKKYDLNLYGFNKVSIYENKIYGSILEIEKIGMDNFFPQIIDLKIIIYNDVSFAFEFTDEYDFFSLSDVKVDNKKYYLDIKDEKDLLKYIEYGKIIYKKRVL